MYIAVEKLGRAGGLKNRERKQKEWDERMRERQLVRCLSI